MATESPVYRSPDPPPARPPWNPRAVRAFVFAVSPFVLLPVMVGATMVLGQFLHRGMVAWVLLGLPLTCVAAVALGVVGARRGAKVLTEEPTYPVPERGRGLAKAASIVGVLGAIFSVLGFFMACLSTMAFSRGRQLRRRGRVLLPPVARGATWTTRSLAVTVDDAMRDALAAQWRENGRTEHASVAAFARLTLDLMALGAPAVLLAGAQRDAADEVRHTELCFSLARAIDGREDSPGAFPEAAKARTLSSVRSVALAQLAVDSLVDGALHEGVSARVVAKLKARCDDEAIRKVLEEIAADEGRHAAHGWDVVAWCLAAGGATVASALRGALDGLPETMRSPLPKGAEGGAWERWGIHGHALEAEEYASTLRDLKERVARMCRAAH
jgi:hypothetical protein